MNPGIPLSPPSSAEITSVYHHDQLFQVGSGIELSSHSFISQPFTTVICPLSPAFLFSTSAQEASFSTHKALKPSSGHRLHECKMQPVNEVSLVPAWMVAGCTQSRRHPGHSAQGQEQGAHRPDPTPATVHKDRSGVHTVQTPPPVTVHKDRSGVHTAQNPPLATVHIWAGPFFIGKDSSLPW